MIDGKSYGDYSLLVADLRLVYVRVSATPAWSALYVWWKKKSLERRKPELRRRVQYTSSWPSVLFGVLDSVVDFVDSTSAKLFESSNSHNPYPAERFTRKMSVFFTQIMDEGCIEGDAIGIPYYSPRPYPCMRPKTSCYFERILNRD